MKAAILTLLALWGLSQVSQQTQRQLTEFEARVTSVHDGDTFTVETTDQKWVCRLENVDAPELAQPYGRAVSAADYLAMARAYMGVVNAGLVQRWDPAQLAFVIDILIISDGGDVSPDLHDYLAARSSPGVQVNVSAAQKVAVPAPGMVVQIDVAPDHVAGPVRDAAAAELFAPDTGLLSAARLPIGAPVFRSVVLAALHAVPGVAEVRAIRFGGAPMGMAIVAPAGGYYDFAANGSVT